jgi:amino acid permease
VSTAISLIVSTVLTVVCISIPTTTDGLVVAKASHSRGSIVFHANGQIVLLYASIFLEFIVLLVQLNKKFQHHISVSAIAERYGALTLVILYVSLSYQLCDETSSYTAVKADSTP